MTHRLRLAIVGQAEYNSPTYETDLDDLYTVEKFPVIFDHTKDSLASDETMTGLIAFAPDITIFFRPEFFSEDLLQRVSGKKIGISTEPFPKLIDGTFHFSRDSIVRFKNFLKSADLSFDHIFHYDSSSLDFMELMGIRVSGAVNLPVAIQTWREGVEQAREWDVVFLGRSTEHRENFFGPLKRDFKFLHIAHGIVGLSALPYYQAARIGVNVRAELDLAWEPRLQQLMASGLLVVSEPISPNNIFAAGEHFIEAGGSAEMYDICCNALSDPQKFENIRRAGYETVRSQLAARQIWPELIEKCITGEFGKATFDLGRVRLSQLEICAEFNGFEHLLNELRGDHA